MKIGIQYEGSKKVSYNWKDLRLEIADDVETIPYYKDLFDLTRILSLNSYFVVTLKKVKEEYKSNKISLLKGTEKLLNSINIDNQWHYLIKQLITQDYFSPGQELYYSRGQATWFSDDKEFTLIIHHPISKNTLYKIVDSIWKNSKEDIEKLPKLKLIPNISDRDARIVELREDKKMKYSNIADQIQKEFRFNNSDGSINEDSIKTAYKRASKKITALNKKR